MDDEIQCLKALYPSFQAEKLNEDSLVMSMDYSSQTGINTTLNVFVSNVNQYPKFTSTDYKIERGLSDSERAEVLEKIKKTCGELASDEPYLTIIFDTFTRALDELVQTCTICNEQINVDELYLTNCFHAFHKDCFVGWGKYHQESRQESIEAETIRNSRRQRENEARADVSMATQRVNTLVVDRERFENRKQVLTRRIELLNKASGSKSQLSQQQPVKSSSISKSKTTLSEREKNDDELDDISEAEKRLTEVKQNLNDNSKSISTARKLLSKSELSLNSLLESLRNEENLEISKNSRITTCPICRNICEMNE